MTELHFLSLAQLSHKIREQEITPQEVAQDYLRRIKKLQPRLKAFAHVDAESAAREAQVAGEAVLGRQPLGPLHDYAKLRNTTH